MLNYGYHLARARGRLVSRLYQVLLPIIVSRRIRPPRQLPIDVFSYSSESRLAEQVASIRSFLRYAGRPARFIVVSDGSHSRKSIRLLESVDPIVSVEHVPTPAPETPPSFAAYLATHVTGKQLALLMSLPRERPTLYIDSDVLFFPGASALNELLRSPGAPAYYLQDCGFAGDENVVNTLEEKARPVNIGVLLFFQKLDWSFTEARFAQSRGEPNFFTGQTITHLAVHTSRARPLDPLKYVLQIDDQFIYRDLYAGRGIALRHYVDPVRHKFWANIFP
jgi:hypothetical protein